MERVGFIGVGAMGGAIAARMVQKGVPVLAYDKSPDALEKIRARGASVATSARDVADQTEIVFACLTTPEICREAALGPEGIAGGAKAKIYIEASTSGSEAVIALSVELAKRGITLLDSPIVGGKVGVEAGTLGVMTAGPKAAFERAKFALESFSGRLFYLGEKPGIAQTAKVMNNSLTHAGLLAAFEAVTMGMKAGLDMETAVAIINQGSGANYFTQRVFPAYMLQGKYEGTGAIEIGLKDMRIYLAEAKHLNVATPVGDAMVVLQKQIAETGPLGRDTLTTFHYFTDLAGMPRQG